jgi:hypothetical protein
MSLFPVRQVDEESGEDDEPSTKRVQYVYPGVKTSVASVYEIMKASGFGPGTNGSSSMTLEKLTEFLQDNGVNVNDDAPTRLAVSHAGNGKRKSESSTVDSTITKKTRGNDASVDLTNEEEDTVLSTPPRKRGELKAPDSTERFMARLKAQGMLVVPSTAIMPPPPPLGKLALSGDAGGATQMFASPPDASSSPAPASALAPVHESQTETADEDGITPELEKAIQQIDIDLQASRDLGFVPNDAIAGVSTKDLDRMVADFACKNSGSVDSMLVHATQKWRLENQKLRASLTADEFKLRIMMGMRNHAWFLLYGKTPPEDDDFLMGNNYGAAVVAKWHTRSHAKSNTPRKAGGKV